MQLVFYTCTDAITLNHLQEIYEKLISVSVKWYDLGKTLGLEKDTLSAIDIKFRDDKDCLQEMLTKRLQSGGPLSWRVLCDSLKCPTVRCNDVATEIEKENIDSPEYMSLTKCFPHLVRIIEQSPNDVADRLRPSGILAPSDLTFLKNPQKDDSEKARRIMHIVTDQVKQDAQVFNMFLRTLKDAGDWTRVAIKRLREEYSAFIATTEQSSSTYTPEEIFCSHSLPKMKTE